MKKHLDNIFLEEKGDRLKYKPVSQGGGKTNYPVRDSRKGHGERIRAQFEYAWKKAEEEHQHRMAVSMSAKDGVYLQIKGRMKSALQFLFRLQNMIFLSRK